MGACKQPWSRAGVDAALALARAGDVEGQRARLFAGGAVREERTEDDGAMRLLIELPPEAMAAIARQPGVKLTLLAAKLPCAHA